MYLACYTEEEIAEAVDVTQKTVNNQLQELEKSAEMQKFLIFSKYEDQKRRDSNVLDQELQSGSERIRENREADLEIRRWIFRSRRRDGIRRNRRRL